MKSFRIHAITLGIIGLSLFACQSTNNQTMCEPALSPFSTPPTDSSDDVRVAYAPNIAIDRVCAFNGKVTRAQVYKQQLAKGLVLCLRPHTSWHENDGWEIVISDTTDDNCGQGFNGIVTPPFHGENPIFIGGYQFRNQDNTAENDGSVNAPQKIRSFNFLFSKKDWKTVWSAHSCITWNQCEDRMTMDEAAKVIATMPKSGAVLTITALELGNLNPNDHAWIESMEFEVKVYLPAEY